MIYERFIDVKEEVKRRSIFLFGPRQTGKSFFLKENFKNAIYYNLLHSDVYLRLLRKPSALREELLLKIKESSNYQQNILVIIDEIQKVPLLLDEVHALIEEYNLKFILTGSSARKLKKSGVNLLAGRALVRNLFPLVYPELNESFDLDKVLNQGALPAIYQESPDVANEILKSYVGTYLKEEIIDEALTRNIENFSSFLNSAALTNGQILNFTSIASDSGVPPRTVIEYYKILEDTLVGTQLHAFKKTKTRKAISTSKFYFFDLGVINALTERGTSSIKGKSILYGEAFEHFIFLELKAYLSYSKSNKALTFWRSTSGFEVDFLIGDSIAIEVKAIEVVSKKHFSGLKALSEELQLNRKIIVCLEPVARISDNIEIYPVEDFLRLLWSGDFIYENVGEE